MSKTCTIEITVDEKGKFKYYCAIKSPMIQVYDNKNINVNGLKDVTLTLKMKDASMFDGFLVSEDAEPRLNHGWTSTSTLGGFGITPLEPSPWPANGATTSCQTLSFKLNIPDNKHIYHFKLVAKRGEHIFFHDPKIYNDPPTDPHPGSVFRRLFPWLPGSAAVGKWAEAGLKRLRH